MAQLKNTTISDTGSLQLPVGTTAQRPSPAAGQMRFNTNTGKAEFYNAATAAWLGTAAAGVVATGGTVYDTDVEGTTYRVHVFTSTGNSTFAVTRGGPVEYLVVAGGGGGGAGWNGGGGGAGGVLTGVTAVTPQAYTVIVGTSGINGRGDGAGDGRVPTNGGNSSAFGITATGGGSGGQELPDKLAQDGGSGGGGVHGQSSSGGTVQPGGGISGQGNSGGAGVSSSPDFVGGGGGGAGSAGVNATSSKAGNGGQGILSQITGNSVFYAGGGGGSHRRESTNGLGGLGGGGFGGAPTPGTDATPNTGGGGGAGATTAGGSNDGVGGGGGSGIVIIRYPLRQENPVTAAGKTAGDGVVLDLDFAKPAVYAGAGTTVSDSRLNGLTGTLSNGTFGINNRSHRAGLFFDGSDDRLDTSMRQVFSDQLTIECWYRGTKTARNHLWNFTGSNLHCNFNDGPYPLWMYWEGSGSNRVRYNGNFTDGTIKHLVFTHSGSTNKVFLNGAELPIAESGGTQTFTGVGGSGFNVGDTAFGGDIYVLKVYQKALTATEIQQNYNATRWRFGV